MHKQKFHKSIQTTKGYKKHLISAYNIKECDIKKEENIKKVINKITYNDVIKAIENAKNISKLNFQNNKNSLFKINKKTYYDNPDTNIHIFIESVLKKCGLINN